MKVLLAQSCLTLVTPQTAARQGLLSMGSWTRILEWVAIPFSRGSSQASDRTQVSRMAGRSLPCDPQGSPMGEGGEQ